MPLTDLFDKNAWQCHPTTPGPRRTAGVLQAGATGKLTGRHAPTRQGGSGEQGVLLGCKSVQAAPNNQPPHKNNPSQSSGWGLWGPNLPSLHRPSYHLIPYPTPQQIHNIRQHSSTGPPPLLLAPRASVPSVQIQGQRIIQQGLIRVANVPNTSLLVNIPQVRAVLSQGGAHALQTQHIKGPQSWGIVLSLEWYGVACPLRARQGLVYPMEV